MKKVSRRNFLKASGAMAAAGALAACGGSGASPPAASGAASTSTAASAAAAGDDKLASLGDITMTVGHAQPEGNPRFVSMEQFAADVAEATMGLLSDWHMPKGRMLTIGAKSIMVAFGLF